MDYYYEEDHNSPPPDPTKTLLRKLYEFVKGLEDRSAYDGDGRVDTWQSVEFETLLERVEEHLGL